MWLDKKPIVGRACCANKKGYVLFMGMNAVPQVMKIAKPACFAKKKDAVGQGQTAALPTKRKTARTAQTARSWDIVAYAANSVLLILTTRVRQVTCAQKPDNVPTKMAAVSVRLIPIVKQVPFANSKGYVQRKEEFALQIPQVVLQVSGANKRAHALDGMDGASQQILMSASEVRSAKQKVIAVCVALYVSPLPTLIANKVKPAPRANNALP